jgi:hypothetical protein
VHDINGNQARIADSEQDETTPAMPMQVDISSAATRLFALLFLVKGIECCATSKVQGEHALAEVMHPAFDAVMKKRIQMVVFPNHALKPYFQAVADMESLNQQEVMKFSSNLRMLVAIASQRGE